MDKKRMEEKIEQLLKELTIEEKIKMIHGDALFYSGGVERLGIPPLQMSDGPMGVRNQYPRDSWIPVGNSDDFVTYCPSNSAIAATWNRQLAYATGQVLGQEARGRGKDIILAPGINIMRTPANGRNFEYMSEDPYLISQMVVPLIEGIQESDVAACVKHFALNNQETERLWVNVEIEERPLREIYLSGFEAAVKNAHVYSLMGAYNLFRGEHCCQNRNLLGDILRQEWEYDGLIVSDWGAVHDTRTAAESPLDIEMSVTYDFDAYCMASPLLSAVKDKEVEESSINEKIRNILRLMLRLKMIDTTHDESGHICAVEDKSRKTGSYNTPAHRQAVLETARESIVLLKNEENRLPLQPDTLESVLVIGDNAERLHASGGGSAEIKALYEISPLMGLKSTLGGNTQVQFARGYYVSPKEEAQASWQENSIEEDKENEAKRARERVNEEILAKRRELREEAVALAKEAKEVILVCGLNHDYDVEGFDRETTELPYEQDTLITEVLKVNPNAIIVVRAGNAVSMGKWKEQAKAIVWDWYSGMEGGNALAEVLLGKVNPSGKLPESMPYEMRDCGAHALGDYPGRTLTEQEEKQMNAHLTQTYHDGIYVGYRYYETYQIPVQFCFGHGLSYTRFSYSNISVTLPEGKPETQEAIAAIVHATITNCGERDGKEIVQVYVRKTDSEVERPVKELKGFQKVELLKGESKQVEIPLDRRAFSYYSESENAFVMELGKYEICVSASLNDCRGLCQIELT